MKLACILSILILSTPLAFSQNNADFLRHQARIGVGTVFFGSGDITGLGYRNEYEYLFRKRFSLAGSLNFGQGSRETRGIQRLDYRRIKNIITLDAVANFAPIDSRYFKLKIGIGPSLKYQTDNDPAFLGFRVEPRVGEIVDYRFQGPMRSLALGATVPLSMEFYANRWSFQLRPSLSVFNDGETNTLVAAGVGYRF